MSDTMIENIFIRVESAKKRGILLYTGIFLIKAVPAFLFLKKIGPVEIIVFHNVLGGINRRWKARIDWRNHINGFDFSAVPAGGANWRRYP
jgi:hypothetical protein